MNTRFHVLLWLLTRTFFTRGTRLPLLPQPMALRIHRPLQCYHRLLLVSYFLWNLTRAFLAPGTRLPFLPQPMALRIHRPLQCYRHFLLHRPYITGCYMMSMNYYVVLWIQVLLIVISWHLTKLQPRRVCLHPFLIFLPG